MHNMPIINITVENMKQTMMTYLGKYNDELQDAFCRAIELELSSDAMEHKIRNIVKEEMSKAVEEKIRNFFTYGEGADAIEQSMRSLKITPNIKGSSKK